MEAVKVSIDQDERRDTCRVAYIIHFLLGAGNLLPWNALITAVDYFAYLYPTKHIEKVFSVAYMISSVLVLLMMMSWGGWSRTTLRLRMNVGYSMFVMSLMVPPVIDWASSSTKLEDRPSGAYGLTVAAVVICGLADGLVGGSLIGSAGKLPKQYMQAVSPELHHQYKLPVMQEYYQSLQHDNTLCSGTRFWAVAGKIKGPAFAILIIYVVTLSIFPGFIAEDLESKLLMDWYPILLITVYNLADLIGKSLTAFYVIQSITRAIWTSIIRLLFYPLFILCLHGPKWLKSEVPMIALTFLLGVTNGYLTSVLMIQTPKSVPFSESELSAIVMIVFLGFGLVGGSVLGWFWIL
ncbi:Equilibrative nucleotide transporter [Arachis hypogaea]|nr:Equilibrative nucleotide transporter [Arachis hypogaea]